MREAIGKGKFSLATILLPELEEVSVSPRTKNIILNPKQVNFAVKKRLKKRKG